MKGIPIEGSNYLKSEIYFIKLSLFVCLSVCLHVCSAIQIHNSLSIWTKIGMKHSSGQEQRKVTLLMHSVEPRSAKQPIKKRKCQYLGNHWTDFNQNWCMDAYTMCKYHLKNRNDRVAQRRAELQKTEDPISWKPLNQSQPDLPYGWILHAEVSF